MNPYDTFGSPTEEGPDRKYGRDEDAYPRSGDSYRRRSPGNDRRRPPPRNRSRSPVAIDRYQPGDRDRGPRDDYYEPSRQVASRDREDRRRAPSPVAANIDRYVPGQDTGKTVPKTNPFLNPINLDLQVGFSDFANWWRAEQQVKEEKERAKHGGRRPSDRVKGEREAREDREKERAQIQIAYDQYKLDLQVKMARQFVLQHRGEEWFKERYVPEIRDPIRVRLMSFRSAAFEQWEADIQKGVFDEFTLEGIYKSDSDGAGGIIEKEEGEATGVGEVLGVLDLLPAKGGELRDESAMQPALLIKTLAPNVSREKVEEFCKEHLGEQEGGFKWLSLSDPNPAKKCHRIGWIMLHPGGEVPDTMQEVERGDGRDEEDEEADGKVLANGETAKTPAIKAQELINGKTILDPVRGDFTCHVGVHNPPNAPRKKALWDLFSAPERVERDYELARRLATKLETEFGKDETAGGLAMIDARVEQLKDQGLLQPAAASKVKKSNGFEDNDDEIKFEDEAEEGEEDEGAYEDETDDEDLIYTKKKLDLIVEYLRRVFNFCFFCVFESDSVHELVRKCPGGHLRRPRAGLSTAGKAAARASAFGEPFPSKKKDNPNPEDGEEPESPVRERNPRHPKFHNKTDQQLLRAFNWVKTFEDKILQVLEPEYVDLKKIGGRSVDEALEEELSKFVKQEDESKYRCKVPECTKLFKAEHFWRKHVEKRHEEWFTDLKKDLTLVNSYVLDPSHIAPSRSDANSNGHFPLPNIHQSNSSRGFNFPNMNMMSFSQNGMMNMNGMQTSLQPGPGYVAAGGMQNPFAMGMGDISGAHNPGAVRRGGGRYNNQRTGPYDRRGGNSQRVPRYSADGFGGPPMGGLVRIPSGGIGMGMGMGFVAQGGGGGGGRWGDGAGGGMNAMGPREAVQGRSIKSYEDLDAQPASAAGGSGTGSGGPAAELDY